MRTLAPQRIAVVAAALLLAAALSTNAQELRSGTKTVPEDVVAWRALATPTADVPGTIQAAAQELEDTVRASGLTPVGPIYLQFGADRPPAAGTIEWELQLPLAEAVTAEDFPEGGEVQVKVIPERLVAYTYHLGPLEGAQPSMLRLLAWVADHKLTLAGPIWLVLYERDPSVRPDAGLVELQVEVAK